MHSDLYINIYTLKLTEMFQLHYSTEYFNKMSNEENKPDIMTKETEHY